VDDQRTSLLTMGEPPYPFQQWIESTVHARYGSFLDAEIIMNVGAPEDEVLRARTHIRAGELFHTSCLSRWCHGHSMLTTAITPHYFEAKRQLILDGTPVQAYHGLVQTIHRDHGTRPAFYVAPFLFMLLTREGAEFLEMCVSRGTYIHLISRFKIDQHSYEADNMNKLILAFIAINAFPTLLDMPAVKEITFIALDGDASTQASFYTGVMSPMHFRVVRGDAFAKIAPREPTLPKE
jgi:hypothetical protein